MGIWPPSKPLMATPDRDDWPLTPRPPVLPVPEPIPRPTRLRFLRAPSLSVISFSFMVVSPVSLVFDDTDQVADLGDHATHGRRVLERTDAVHLVEAEADQGLFLTLRAPNRRT